MAENATERRATVGRRDPGPAVPPELREQLRRWIDIDEVGAEGLWLWLERVLPLLPAPHRVSRVMREAKPGEAAPDRVQELARDLVDCAADRAKLTVNGQRYYADNQLLARRVKALEAVLRTLRAAGHPVNIPLDDDAEAAAGRYLPVR